MDNKIKLSIVTAYYKTYDLTKKLIDTLLPQLTNEVEWIIVDDGCNETRFDEFKEIKTIHIEENSGACNAYNVGIDNATGSYIGFIDGDDLVSYDYIKTLINAINSRNEDLIFMDWQDLNTRVVHKRPNNYAGWKCIYKREKLPRFPIYERNVWDVPVHEEIMKDKYTKYYVDKILYFYNSGRVGSVTQMKYEEYLKNKKRK